MRHIKGVHLIIDGYVGCEDVFSQPFIFDLIYRLVDNLEMKILTEPLCKEVPVDWDKLNSENDEGGTSYFCMITTSHISLHIWPLRKAFMMDIFSCVPFEVELAKNLVIDSLGVTEYTKNVLFRTDPRMEEKLISQR